MSRKLKITYFLLELKKEKCDWENDINKYNGNPITSGNASHGNPITSGNASHQMILSHQCDLARLLTLS
jgi:hypothetical protein